MEMAGEKKFRRLNFHMADNSLEPSAQEMRGVDQSVSDIMDENREVKLRLVGDFNALRTIEQMTDLMQPVGYFEKIILDFSRASLVNAVELYRLFAEIASAPHFNYIEICIEGLQFRYWEEKN
jgi:hypothetical protein